MPKLTITLTLESAIASLEKYLDFNKIKPNTIKAKQIEHAFIVGLATAVGESNVPPIIMMCVMSGRSILTMKETKVSSLSYTITAATDNPTSS